MPNHVTNRLRVVGKTELVKKVVSKLTDEDGCVDFNISTPIPEELKNTSSPSNIISESEYKKQEERSNSGEKLFTRGLTRKISDELKNKYGYDNWYEWQINAWGTKWNAYSQEVLDENTFKFETAWSTPFNFIKNFSLMYPEVTLEVSYADEDMGYNLGEYHIKNGVLTLDNQLEFGSYEAFKFAVELQGGSDSWVVNDLITDLDKDALENAIHEANGGVNTFEGIAVKLAYEFNVVNDKFPIELNQHLMEKAIEGENYAYAIKLRDLTKVVERNK